MNTTKVLLRRASGLTYLHKLNEANSELSVSLVPIESSGSLSFRPMKLELWIDGTCPGAQVQLNPDGTYDVYARAPL